MRLASHRHLSTSAQAYIIEAEVKTLQLTYVSQILPNKVCELLSLLLSPLPAGCYVSAIDMVREKSSGRDGH